MTVDRRAAESGTHALVRRWLDSGRLDVPLPGCGATAQRWHRLMNLAEEDLGAGRLAEAHTDAAAILHELGEKPPNPHELWGVWAAESSTLRLVAKALSDNVFLLDGTKPWCSGASLCTHALVTAEIENGQRALFAVALDAPTVTALPSAWSNIGLASTDTRAVQFTATRAVHVGAAGGYLERAGFWHGAIGVAACWLGGAHAVARPLYRYAVERAEDPHLLAHLGAVDATLAGADAMLSVAAAQVDADPFDRTDTARLLARRTRAVIEHAVEEVITRTGRAMGPEPLCHDNLHAQRVADLVIYVRQSHAERDLADLGRLCRPRR